MILVYLDGIMPVELKIDCEQFGMNLSSRIRTGLDSSGGGKSSSSTKVYGKICVKSYYTIYPEKGLGSLRQVSWY